MSRIPGFTALFFCISIALMSGSAGASVPNFVEIFSKAKPAVVLVVSAEDTGAASGSGFVLSSTAQTSTVITANHVIEGASRVDVILDSNTRERYRATVVYRDHDSDVAILRIAVGHRATLRLSKPADIQEGMAIAVIGYPRATLSFFRQIEGDDLRPSVHSGIISAIRVNGQLIQFDAAVDHGDSGGPIIDMATGHVVGIVRGEPLDTTLLSQGVQEGLPGTAFGPSAARILAVLAMSRNIRADISSAVSSTTPARSYATSSASYRVGYGVPTTTSTGDPNVTGAVNAGVSTFVLGRIAAYLRSDNSLYLIPIQFTDSAYNAEELSGFCSDNRLNALVEPVIAWELTGGPRYNAYGMLLGYSGQAQASVTLYVSDCFGIPFFLERQTKTENRYFAHRTPDREIVDMANDLLDQLLSDFTAARAAHAAAWDSLLRTGLAVDPTDGRLHALMALGSTQLGYQVQVVVPGGPADRAGVRVQDVLVSVNGQSATVLTLQQVVDALNAPQVTLELSRPGGVVTVTVYPKPYDQLLQMINH